MRFREVRKRKVIDIRTAERVAEVDGFVVDPAQAKIVLVRLRKVRGEGKLVEWDALRAFGTDAVTIDGVEAIRAPRDEREKRGAAGDLELVGRALLTERGRALGEIADVEFDPESGRILTIATKGETIDGARLIGVGGFAAVVREDT